MIEKKLNYIWKELHALPSRIEEALTKNHESQSKQLDDVVHAIENQSVTVENKIDTTDISELQEKSFRELQTLPTKTFQVEVINQVEQKEIEFPEQPETIKLNQKQFDELKKALKVENNIEVQASDVQVEKQFSDNPKEYVPNRLTNGKKFVNIDKRFDDVVTAVNQISTNVTVSNSAGEEDPTSVYKPSDIDNGASTQYFGFVTASGAWFIQRIGNDKTEIRYFKGASNYTTGWTNRATHSYNYFDVIF